jgi:hypothetical protein
MHELTRGIGFIGFPPHEQVTEPVAILGAMVQSRDGG